MLTYPHSRSIVPVGHSEWIGETMYALAVILDILVRFIGILIFATGVAQGLALSGVLDPTPFQGLLGGLMPSVLSFAGTYLVFNGLNLKN